MLSWSRGLPPSRAEDPFAEACVFWYVVLTPLWWMTGTLLPLGVAGAALLFLRRPPRRPAIVLVSALWAAVGAAQWVSTAANWVAAEEGSRIGLLRGLLSSMSTGWILIGLCIGVGGAAGLASPRVVRAVCVQAMWILLFSAGSLAAAHALGLPELIVPSPLALLLPGDLPVVRQQLTMQFYQMDALMDGQALRLTLFYPWATALSLAGAVALLVGPGDPVRRWRLAAIAGGLAAVLFGHSRSVVVCLAGALCVLGVLRLPTAAKGAVALAGGLGANVALLAGLEPTEALRSLHGAFTSVRAGSSAARQLVYDLSWAHFLERPLLGHGWVSEPVARWLPTMPLGSHSSFYGVLYLGGIVTFGLLCLAYVATLALAARRLRDRPREGPTALALLLLLGVVAFGENINVHVPSLLVTFVWLGGVLRPAAGLAPGHSLTTTPPSGASSAV